MDQPRTIFISNESKKAPVHRGFLGVGIVPTGELEGRQDRLTPCFVSSKLYQLGNWKAGKIATCESSMRLSLYQLGNWKAGKTATRHRSPCRSLYQLGNWKAGKTS